MLAFQYVINMKNGDILHFSYEIFQIQCVVPTPKRFSILVRLVTFLTAQ